MNRTKKDPRTMSADELMHACMDGMQPFSITFTTPEETQFLFNATMKQVFGIKSGDAVDLMHLYISKLGNEAGLEHFVKDAKEHKGFEMPRWFIPMVLHIIATAETNLGPTNQEEP